MFSNVYNSFVHNCFGNNSNVYSQVKSQYICNMEYYSAKEINEILVKSTKKVEIKRIMLSE